MSYHIGRSWVGHALEDVCPCPKAPCGLVVSIGLLNSECNQHGFSAGRTIRQMHTEELCPARQLPAADRVADNLEWSEFDDPFKEPYRLPTARSQVRPVSEHFVGGRVGLET